MMRTIEKNFNESQKQLEGAAQIEAQRIKHSDALKFTIARPRQLQYYDDAPNTEPSEVRLLIDPLPLNDHLQSQHDTNQHPSNPYIPNVSFEIIKPPDPFQATVIDMDPFLDSSSVEISQPPEKQNLDPTAESVYGKDIYDDDLYIDVPDRPLKDPVDDLDFNHDPPTPPTAEPLEPIGPSTTAVAINFPPIDPTQDLPKRFADNYSHSPDAVQMCVAPWLTQKPTHDAADIPETELFPTEAPSTVRGMLIWLAGLQHTKHHVVLEMCINDAFKRGDGDVSSLQLPVNGAHILPQHVIDTIQLAAVFAASVLSAIEPAWKGNISLFATLKRKDSDQSKDADCCALLCQLRDYVYACCHQLAFLKSQCSRDQLNGGWQDCPYGCDVSSNSPLQAFLTDASDFETHFFDPCNICRKSRVHMGFREEDLPDTQQTGKHLHTILSPTCGGEDPLLRLASYLTCLTRRTPRTTGELVSFFHNFGNEMHSSSSQSSKVGTSLTNQHDDCPGWDRLRDSDLHAIKDARGSVPPSSIHDHGDFNTLSTLLGCGIDNVQCPQLMMPITYRAYALYSSSFAHDYLSWAVHLADRLHESLLRLHCDLERLQCHDSKLKSIHQQNGVTLPRGR
ncbi:Ribosome-binding protein 1 [Babesia ovata]|uniref:Ribosome-binding protein 1 n=1 Tax=Babesia ovata TaxID=189622 RepID=A0A2H6KFL5_9APIC|nr:Ribosome-binding protein 1 [Babesia ovata]GBE61788.1 Ribosome-binding protein 1 [Babesia ovata]